MDIETARTELIQALASAAPTGSRFRAARDVLIARGSQVPGIARHPRLALDEPRLDLEEIVRLASATPPSEPRRVFAVLLVHALGIPGLLPSRGRFAADAQSFLEHALLNPLRRAGYPFAGSVYDKRQFLEDLHATIDEHLRPLEPSILRWIHGLGSSEGSPRDQ
jgi:hypothetical protein